LTTQDTAHQAPSARPGEDRYHLSIRVLHWLMAVGFLFMWGLGWAMTNVTEDDSPAQKFLFGLHISVGVTLLALLILRIAIRWRVGAPPLPAALPRRDRIGARIGHIGLYALPLLIVTLGWASRDFGGHGVDWFGLTLPEIFPATKSLAGIKPGDLAAELHGSLAWTLLALAVIHIAAVAKHRWVDRHDVLHRITLGRGASRPHD
jgi:cytochrome b561